MPLQEPALICEPTREVRKVDKGNGTEYALLVGRITGAHVKVRTCDSPNTSRTDTFACSTDRCLKANPRPHPHL